MRASSSRRAFAAVGRKPEEERSAPRRARRRIPRRSRRSAPGIGTTGKPASRDRAHEPRAGIADRRRAGVAHERDALPGARASPTISPARARFVVLVQR